MNNLLVQCCLGLQGAALPYHFTGARLAIAALGGYAKLELDFVKTHPGVGVASNFPIRYAMANTDNHWLGSRRG